MICVFLIMIILLLVSFVFQIRDFYYLSRYKKPYDNTVRCRFRRIHTKERGFKVVECTNIFWNKKFEKLGKHCPSNCRGSSLLFLKAVCGASKHIIHTWFAEQWTGGYCHWINLLLPVQKNLF